MIRIAVWEVTAETSEDRRRRPQLKSGRGRNFQPRPTMFETRVRRPLEPSHNWYCTGLENRRPKGMCGFESHRLRYIAQRLPGPRTGVVNSIGNRYHFSDGRRHQ